MEEDQSKPRAQRTKAERKQLLVELRASGRSVREFAVERGLPPSSVYQWVRSEKLAQPSRKGKKGNQARPPTPAFAELKVVGQVTATSSRTPAITVSLRCGHAVTFESERLDLAWLKSVLKVISAC